MANIEITVNNTDKVKSELAARIPIILEAVGLEAAGNAVDEINKLVYDGPESPNYVRTGRLKNSIGWATPENSGTINTPNDPGDFAPNGTPEKNSVYIGTNVKYAPYVELGTSKMPARPFLKNAATKYEDDYKKIVEDGLK